MTTVRDLTWWYWLMTAVLLSGGVYGWPWGVPFAIALCGIQVMHFGWRTGSIAAFPVQVRIIYLLLLAAGLWAPFQWIHPIQVVGTSARVLFGYCLLREVCRSHRGTAWNRCLGSSSGTPSVR